MTTFKYKVLISTSLEQVVRRTRKAVTKHPTDDCDDFFTEMMFTDNNWDITNELSEADLVCFTGGADINPGLYGEKNVLSYGVSIERDAMERELFFEAVDRGIPILGICRGAQLICALTGGSLYQDVDNHAMAGCHPMRTVGEGDVIKTNSVHHQMMIPGPGAVVLAVSYGQSSARTNMYCTDFGDANDPEAVYWPKYKALGVQGHPEYPHSGAELRAYTFETLARMGLIQRDSWKGLDNDPE